MPKWAKMASSKTLLAALLLILSLHNEKVCTKLQLLILLRKL